MSRDVDHLAAYHEGAHAAYATMKGWHCTEVVLHAANANQSEAGHCDVYQAHQERDIDPLGFAVYLLVAGAAERRLVGTVTARCERDYAQARALCAVSLNKDDATADRVERTLATVTTLANATVVDRAFWEWVERVAAALIQRRRLTGRSVQELRAAAR